MSWFDHLDSLKSEIEDLIEDDRFPPALVEVTPAPTDATEMLTRARQRLLVAVCLSLGGMDSDDTVAGNYPGGRLLAVAHVYARDGHTAIQGARIERNRLAARVCEQLHVLLRDPNQYGIETPGRTWRMGRPEQVTVRNLSFRAAVGGKTIDEHGLAHWSVTWLPSIVSEPMGEAELVDLTRITVAVSGADLGGGPHTPADDESTRVDF